MVDKKKSCLNGVGLTKVFEIARQFSSTVSQSVR